MDALSRLLAPRSLRLIICNLDWQRTIRTIPAFTRAKLAEVESTLRNLDFGALDYRTLQQSGNASGMLTGLLARESTADATVIVGYVPFLVDAGEWKPVLGLGHLWYLQLQPGVHSPLAGRGKRKGMPLAEDEDLLNASYREDVAPDHIAEWVGRLGGETFTIGNPNDLATALKEIRQGHGGDKMKW